MADRLLLIEERLVTAAFSRPFRAGWVDDEGVQLIPRVAAADIDGWPVVLLDSIEARPLLHSHVVVREVAVAARRASMLTLATATRPDAVEQAVASVPDASPATRALAAMVVPAFYGIRVTGWTTERRQVAADVIVIQQDVEALAPLDDEAAYQEDLGRAWYLFTDLPFVSHVCLARRDLIADDPPLIVAALERLTAARDAARARGRELRRDLAREFALEREVLADALADQALSLGTEEQRGLEELWKRAGTPLAGSEARTAFVSVRGR